MPITVALEGEAAFGLKLEELIAKTIQSAGIAAYREGEREMAISKDKFVPVDSGALRATGHVEGPNMVGTEVTVDLGFGGPSVDYALYVHEDMTKRHPVGQAKYLETPMREEISTGRAMEFMGPIIKAAIESL